MVRKKQVNNENGAVLNRDFPRRGRSLIMVPEELRRLYPNAKPEHIEMALERFSDYECGDRLHREHADRPPHRPLHRGRHRRQGQTENKILLPYADAGALRQRGAAEAPREAGADEKGDALGVLEGIHRLRLRGCTRQALRSRLRHRTLRTASEEA